MNKFSTKISSFIISLFMGGIIIAFVFTGFENFNSGGNQVASVDGTPITAGEYNRAFQQQLDNYSRYTKKSLTNKQIRDLGLKERTLDSLVQQKMMLNFASDMKFGAGKMAVKAEIKDIPAFQTNKQFDVTKYKQLLKMNNLSPAKFEEDIVAQVKSKKMATVLTNIQDSKAYIKNTMRLRNLKMKAIVATFEKESMTKNLTVSSAKLNEFMKDKKNETLLKSLYSNYENQEKAKKTEKIKTFAQMKSSLSRQHLQKTMRKELTEFNDKLKADLEKLVKTGNTTKLAQLEKKYGVIFKKDHEMTPFNFRFRNVEFKDTDVFPLFKAKDTKQTVATETPTTVAFFKAVSFTNDKAKDEDLKKEIDFAKQRNAGMTNQAIMQYKRETSKVTRSANLL